MVIRIVLGALALGALVVLVTGLPDIARYSKSRSM
jgi:hypothetical protein